MPGRPQFLEKLQEIYNRQSFIQLRETKNKDHFVSSMQWVDDDLQVNKEFIRLHQM